SSWLRASRNSTSNGERRTVTSSSVVAIMIASGLSERSQGTVPQSVRAIAHEWSLEGSVFLNDARTRIRSGASTATFTSEPSAHLKRTPSADLVKLATGPTGSRPARSMAAAAPVSTSTRVKEIRSDFIAFPQGNQDCSLLPEFDKSEN